MSPAAMTVAILALVLAGAGVGWSASQITTKDIKNNAVTSAKVKDGSLKNADLVKEKKPVRIAAQGGPDFSTGGQNDCRWGDGTGDIAGSGAASYRVDRSGIVHLSGIAVAKDGPGGDADCDFSTEEEDGLITVLPPSLRPAETMLVPSGLNNVVIYLVGPKALAPQAPAGAVLVTGNVALLDGISYIPSTSPLAPAASRAAQPLPRGTGLRSLLQHLGGR